MGYMYGGASSLRVTEVFLEEHWVAPWVNQDQHAFCEKVEQAE